MNSKSFEETLWKANYKLERGEPQNLAIAVDDFLSENGAAWLADIRASLNNYLNAKYTPEDIPYSSRKLHRLEKAKVQSEDELAKKLSEKKESYYNAKAVIGIEKLRAMEGCAKVDYIVPMLREMYCKSWMDKVEISAAGLVSEKNFDSVKNKSAELLSKRLPMKESFSDHQYAIQLKNKIEKISLDGDLYNYDFHIGNNIVGKYPEEWNRDKNIALLANMYEKAVTHIPIVYRDLRKALEFFQEETGINVLEPKTSTNYRFGK